MSSSSSNSSWPLRYQPTTIQDLTIHPTKIQEVKNHQEAQLALEAKVEQELDKVEVEEQQEEPLLKQVRVGQEDHVVNVI